MESLSLSLVQTLTKYDERSIRYERPVLMSTAPV